MKTLNTIFLTGIILAVLSLLFKLGVVLWLIGSLLALFSLLGGLFLKPIQKTQP